MSAKKLRDSWAEVNLHPIFNKRFGHGNRFLLWKDKTKGMKPALLNGKYDKFQRTIVIFYENIGTDTEPNLLVKNGGYSTMTNRSINSSRFSINTGLTKNSMPRQNHFKMDML
jgi:hypothetical protein